MIATARALVGLATAVASQVMSGVAPGRNPSQRAAELENVVVMRPADVRAYIELAAEYERFNQRDRAEATLRNAVERASDTRTARMALVDLLARTERWQEAAATATPLATDSAGRTLVARLRVNAGIVSYRAGNRAGAMTDWRGALALDPALVEAAVDLTAALLEAGKRDSARTVVNTALRYNPAEGRLLALRARTLTGQEGVVAALKALRALHAEHPDDESIALELANILVQSSGQTRFEGMVLYDSLVKAPKASERAFVVVTEFFLDGAQSAGAAGIAESGTLKYPRSAALYALLGEAQASKSPPDYRESAAAYRRAIVLTPNPGELQLALLDVHVSAGDTASALAMARDLAASPASPTILLATASRLKPLGNEGLSLADTIYAQMLARDSADVAALEAGGAIAERLGDPARAQTLYARAVALDSSGPEAPLALLRLTRPPDDTARRLLRQALWRGLATLQGLELSGAAAATAARSPRRLAKQRPDVNRRAEVLSILRSTLDTVVFHTPWGPAELRQLQLAYPRSALVAQYAADLSARGQNQSDALLTYDRLLRRDAANPTLHLRRAALLEQLGRTGDAIDAYTRALDLEPENDSTFRAVQRLRGTNGSLEQLLLQVRRLRVRLPDSKLLAEHEVEVLSRLGRYAEAQDVAKQMKGEEKKP